VVTGASSGIGRAIALELAAGGADVVVAARASRVGADETARLIRDMGRAAAVVMADLGTAAGCRDLLRAAWSELERVDIWVNNAGADILTGEGAELDYEEKLERLLKVDVQATVSVVRKGYFISQLDTTPEKFNLSLDNRPRACVVRETQIHRLLQSRFSQSNELNFRVTQIARQACFKL